MAKKINKKKDQKISNKTKWLISIPTLAIVFVLAIVSVQTFQQTKLERAYSELEKDFDKLSSNLQTFEKSKYCYEGSVKFQTPPLYCVISLESTGSPSKSDIQKASEEIAQSQDWVLDLRTSKQNKNKIYGNAINKKTGIKCNLNYTIDTNSEFKLGCYSISKRSFYPYNDH